MSENILQFPESRSAKNRKLVKDQKKRSELADWLRGVATIIQNDSVECEPTAILLVLSGKTGDEVVWKGYADNPEVSLHDAGRAAHSSATCSYKRRGGNFHDRRKP